MLELLHGNKRYSSWSQRGYLALCHAGLPFRETAIWLDTPAGDALLRERCPNGSVPVLYDGDTVIADSLGIVLWLEAQYGVAFWPEEPAARAQALNGVMAMHSGYLSLRGEMVCNYPRRYQRFEVSRAARSDLDAIFDWMLQSRAWFGDASGGPWLCGEYGAADFFYAPVLSRCRTYGVALPAGLESWAEAMESRTDVQAWLEAGEREVERISASEYDTP